MATYEKLMYTGKQIEEIFNRYWLECKEQDRKPTYEGFAGALGISSSTLTDWRTGQNIKVNKDGTLDRYSKWIPVQDSIKRCLDKITDDLQQSKDSMSIFRLKQAHYGGYIDKVQQEQTGALQITIKGSNGVNWSK